MRRHRGKWTAGLAAWAVAAATAASPAQAAQWTLTEHAFNYGSGPFGEVLAYGVNNADALQCHVSRARRGQAHLLWLFGPTRARAPTDAPRPITLTLSSGGASATLKALASDDPDATPPGTAIFVEADFPVASPVLAEFGRTGRLTLRAAGITLTPDPAAAADAARFVQLCGK